MRQKISIKDEDIDVFLNQMYNRSLNNESVLNEVKRKNEIMFNKHRRRAELADKITGFILISIIALIMFIFFHGLSDIIEKII